LPAVVMNQQDVREDAPHVFVPARDDEREQSATE
jgi:hypothetical protein